MKNRLLFILFTIVTIVFFIFISYRYFMTSFIKIEKEINKRNITGVVNIINNNLDNLENLIVDYAKWDNTYDFIKTKNPKYIFENFRDGTDTLEDLEIDFMIFTNLDNEKIFSKYSKSSILKDDIESENNILKEFSVKSDFATFYKVNSLLLKHKKSYFLITKVSISNSDDSIKANGFLYGGKIISSEILNDMSRIFHTLELSDKKIEDKMTSISPELLKNVKINTVIDSNCNCLINTIQFFNYENEFVFSILTNTKRNLIDIGKEAIYSYNIAIGVFLIFISFLLYKNYSFLKGYNQRLLRDVEKKTKDLKETNKKLKVLSETDELTKIHNRRNFFRLGEKALLKSIHNLKNLSVVMMDIDDFKKINDTYGHDIGDRVLIELTKTISDLLEKKHIFGRLGGEEFALILVDTDLDNALIIAEQIREKVSKSIVNMENQNISYTISLGITNRDNKKSLDEILKDADNLLYKSKKSGKNKCSIRDRKTIS